MVEEKCIELSDGTMVCFKVGTMEVVEKKKEEKKKEKMRLVSVHVTQKQLMDMDELVRLGIYPNRSVLIREAIKQLIEKYREKID